MIEGVPSRAVQGPHPAAAGALACALAGALLLSGCSTGGGEEPSPGDPGTSAAQPARPEDGPTGDAARTGSPPEFHGERALAVQAGRTVFVQPSCTPNPDGQRFCWGETGDPIRRAGSPVPVTLTDAAMRLDDLGLEWSVRLTFAEAAPLARAAGAAADADEGRVLLLDEDADLLRPLPAGIVTGRVVTLTGLEKDDAWDLVELVGDP